jgi:hypothetical protein
MSISNNRFTMASPEPPAEGADEKGKNEQNVQNGNENGGESSNNILVENIVDEMLQKAIDEVLVTE